MAGASGDIPKIKSLIAKALSPTGKEWKIPLLKGLTQSLRNNNTDRSALAEERELLLNSSLKNPEPAARRSAMDLLGVLGLPESENTVRAIGEAVLNAKNPGLDEEKRSESIRLLALDGARKHTEIFRELFRPTEPVTVQSAALNALNSIPDSTVSIFLVDKWPGLTPGLKEQAIGTFMGKEPRISILLDALEKDIIDPSVISWPRRVSLMANANEKLRARARKLLSVNSGSQQEVMKAYQDVMTLTSSADKGRLVFAQHCAVCHQIGGKNGISYGPDLATIRNRRPESIMADILDPNLSIADGYDIWNIELKSGEALQGLIATETPSAITIRNYGGVETVVARSDIQALKAMETSVMTAGFDQLIDKQQMADLLAYLRQP
ncbi:MAG: hypothetical protein ABS46_04250 [Cytophagaceae bacterium SCN 52-12]|nr:MAG: hypothetical protein ABS46_04250 [Cytophagaceae bacterium SCN 52-12]